MLSATLCNRVIIHLVLISMVNNKIYLNSIKLEGENRPSWNNIPDDVWQTFLNDFFFKVSDRFAFMGVLEKSDLFPTGLHFFDDWELEDLGLIEFENNIVCQFILNTDCRQKLLKQGFAVHQVGMVPPRNYHDFDEQHYYYEFDELYFFSAERLVGVFINHEDIIEFINLSETELELLNCLDNRLTNDIIDKAALTNSIKGN